MFDFPFPLRAHLKFKCSFTTEDTVSPRVTAEAKHGVDHIRRCSENFPSIKHSDRLQEKCMLNYMTNNNAMFTISSKRLLDYNEHSELPKKFISDNLKPVKDSIISHSIEELSKSYALSERSQDKGLDSHSDNASAFRKVDKPLRSSSDGTSSPPASTPCFVSMSRTLSPPIRNTSSQSVLSPSTLASSHGVSSHKAHSLAHAASTLPRSQASTSSLPPAARPPVKPLPSATTSVAHQEPTLSGPPMMGLYMPRFSLPSPLGIPGGNILAAGTSGGRGLHLPHIAFADQIPPGLLEMCRAAIPSVGPLTESFAANIRNSETLAKQALFADRHISSFGFLKSNNPMVEKLLQSTNPTLLSSPINALNLSQNWCAKCNATFRMTSDLVYHMR